MHHIDHYYLTQVDYSLKSDGLTMLDLVKLTMIRLFGFPPMMIKSDHTFRPSNPVKWNILFYLIWWYALDIQSHVTSKSVFIYANPPSSAQ